MPNKKKQGPKAAAKNIKKTSSLPQDENIQTPTKDVPITDESRGKMINLVQQFTTELCATFPEFTDIISTWCQMDPADKQWDTIMIPHIMSIYPEHFFHIVFRAEEVFNDTNKQYFFIPGLDFSRVFIMPGITEDIKTILWKYLASILFESVSNIEDKSQFKNSAGLFDSVPEDELNRHLLEAFQCCEGVFDQPTTNETTPSDSADNYSADKTDDDDTSSSESTKAQESADKMHQMLEKIMGSKLGKLSETITEELKPDLKEMFPDIDWNVPSENAGAMFKKLLCNPSKLLPLIKKVKDKFQSKLDSGEISRDEMMEDMREMMDNTENGKDGFAEMMREMGKKMGMNGNAMNSRLNMEMNKQRMRERMRKKHEQQTTTAFFNTEKSFRVDGDTVERTACPQSEEELSALIQQIENNTAIHKNGDGNASTQPSTNTQKGKKGKKRKK